MEIDIDVLVVFDYYGTNDNHLLCWENYPTSPARIRVRGQLLRAELRRNHNEAVIHVRLQRIHAREGNIWELELKTAERINILQMGRAGSFTGHRRADWDDVSVPVTVGRCSENSKGENARSGKNSIERGRAERGGNWRSTPGMDGEQLDNIFERYRTAFIHSSYIV